MKGTFRLLGHVARRAWRLGALTLGSVALLAAVGGYGGAAEGSSQRVNPQALGPYIVVGYNDLGMHCMNQDFSDLCVLPPANTLRATVIRRGEDPSIVTSGVTVGYSIPGNANSTTKTNFWQYAFQLFGVNLPPNVGLFGYGLSGKMAATADRDWMAHGIPLTPVTDAKKIDPYQLSQINVVQNGTLIASTQAVVPVSWEMTCSRCHSGSGLPTNHSVAMDILAKHDKLHGTNLVNQRPVLCAKCHADPALGAPGRPGVSTLSAAMHGAHASRMGKLAGNNECYSCHPGPQTQCFRDVHFSKGMTCQNCHVSMVAVGNPARTPWVDEPRCGNCHHVAGHEYEQPGVLFRDSVGHNGVKCIVCHNSPHAITPTVNSRDNLQAIRLQGHAGTIDTCTVCHTQRPDDQFNHTRGD